MNYNNSGSKNKDFPTKQPWIIERIEEYNQAVRRNKVDCILPPCPRCIVTSNQFKRHELRKRQFNVIVEEIVRLMPGLLIRWKCPGCGKTFTQYPEFAFPNKRYVLQNIVQYTERYVEDEKMTYAQLLKKWGAGYERKQGDESQMWPSTIHRWITTLGGLTRVIGKAQALIHQKNPSAGVTRHLAQLTVSCRKFITDVRRKLLVSCRQLLQVERLFRQTFHVSIFPKLALDCAVT